MYQHGVLFRNMTKPKILAFSRERGRARPLQESSRSLKRRARPQTGKTEYQHAGEKTAEGTEEK